MTGVINIMEINFPPKRLASGTKDYSENFTVQVSPGIKSFDRYIDPRDSDVKIKISFGRSGDIEMDMSSEQASVLGAMLLGQALDPGSPGSALESLSQSGVDPIEKLTATVKLDDDDDS